MPNSTPDPRAACIKLCQLNSADFLTPYVLMYSPNLQHYAVTTLNVLTSTRAANVGVDWRLALHMPNIDLIQILNANPTQLKAAAIDLNKYTTPAPGPDDPQPQETTHSASGTENI